MTPPEAAAYIAEDTAGHTVASFRADRHVRQVVERNFEIGGEAMLRVERTDLATAARISGYRKIIGFRNRIAHGYDEIDHAQVWDVIQRLLPVLRAEVDQLYGLRMMTVASAGAGLKPPRSTHEAPRGAEPDRQVPVFTRSPY